MRHPCHDVDVGLVLVVGLFQVSSNVFAVFFEDAGVGKIDLTGRISHIFHAMRKDDSRYRFYFHFQTSVSMYTIHIFPSSTNRSNK